MLGSELGSIDSVPESDGLERPGAAGLVVGFTGFDVAAGVLHAARAAIIASASKSLLNINMSSTASADGCRRWVGLGPECWPEGADSTLGSPWRRPCQLRREGRCSRLAGASAQRSWVRDTSVLGDERRDACGWERSPAMLR